MVDTTEVLEKQFSDVYSRFGKSKTAGNYLFQSVAKDAKLANIGKKSVEEARDWFRKQAVLATNVNRQKMIDTSGPFEKMTKISQNSIGKLYYFIYLAKHKDKLEYWDAFPLIFPIEYYADRMLGINLHYLNPVYRARLMDQLYTTANNDRYDKTTKLQISYKILKNASNMKAFKPCLHMYLYSQLQSPFVIVNPNFWDYCILLPSQNFQKASDSKVWEDSINKIIKG